MTPREQTFSPEVRDVLERVPSWYEQWGTTLVALVVVGALALAWLIRYPDVLTAQAVITTRTPPLTLYSRSTGALTELWPENTKVSAGAWLAVINNAGAATSIRQVQLLAQQTQQQLNHPSLLQQLRPVAYNNLGAAQDEFAAFLLALQAYQYLLGTPHFQQREQNEGTQAGLLKTLNARLQRQQRLQEQEFNVVARQYRRDSLLLASRVIAPAAFETTQAAYLRQKSLLENTKISRQQNELQLAQLAASRIGNREQYTGSQQAAYVRLQEALLRLRSRLDSWEQAYVLKAPMAGRVAYLGSWTAGQQVTANQPVFALLPTDGELVARATLPLRGAGRVHIGQRVLLQVDDFPAEQFGVVAGVVTAISLVPTAGHYLLSIKLTHELHTSTGQQLPFRSQLSGTAQIITQDVRLLDRVFRPIRRLLLQRS